MRLKFKTYLLIALFPLFVFNSCSSDNNDPGEPAIDFLTKYDGSVWKTANGVYLTQGLETEYYFKLNAGSLTSYKEIWAWNGEACFKYVQVPLSLNYEIEIVENEGDFLHVKLYEKVNTPEGLPSNEWEYMYEVQGSELTLHVESTNNFSGDTYEFDEIYTQVSVDTNSLEPICQN